MNSASLIMLRVWQFGAFAGTMLFRRCRMDLYLLRHGEAGQVPRDEDRELTERGHEQARAVAAGLAWLNPGLDAILTSPLPRAVQTAQPVARALGLEVQTADAMAPGNGPDESLALLSGRGARVLLV